MDNDDDGDDDSIQWEMSIMCKAERLMLVSFIYSENYFGLNGTYCAAQIGRALVWTKKVNFLCMNAPPNSNWQLPFCLCVWVCGGPWHSLAFFPFRGGVEVLPGREAEEWVEVSGWGWRPWLELSWGCEGICRVKLRSGTPVLPRGSLFTCTEGCLLIDKDRLRKALWDSWQIVAV